MELEKPLAFKDDEEFLNDLVKIKREKKEALVAHIKEHEGEELNRFHFRYSDQTSA